MTEEDMDRFYLGVHRPNWLSRADVPLFVSYRTLMKRKSLPEARSPWALDSGAFTEINLFGEHVVSAHTYAVDARRYRDEIGQLDFASIQDWMCEPSMLQRTGLTVGEHIRRTVDSYIELRDIAPDLPWLPVIQGWQESDYLRCIDEYERRGVRLADLPVVGIGTVCKRQHMGEAHRIVSAVASQGIRVHVFGFKILGLRQCGTMLHSADSMAWSYRARRLPAMEGHTHRNCANCYIFARAWYDHVHQQADTASQWHLPLEDVA